MVAIKPYEYHYVVDGYQYAERPLEGLKFDIHVILISGKYEITVSSKTKPRGIDMAYWYQEALETEDKAFKEILARDGEEGLISRLIDAGDGTDGNEGLDW